MDTEINPREKQEYITCAAIWYKDLDSATYNPINIDSGIVICGHRHPNCIDVMSTLGKLRTVQLAPDGVGNYIQGFLTSKNRFVDREEGRDIAKKAGQIGQNQNHQLYSEDIY